MLKKQLPKIGLALLLMSPAALAESSSYHLKKLDIQARAFLAQLGGPLPDPRQTPADAALEVPLEQQLGEATEAPSWAENMVRQDVNSLLNATQTLLDNLENGDTESYLKAKVELESLARRLRVSTAPLKLDPQQQASLELMMLELNEAASSVGNERQEVLAARDARRRRNRVNVGVGFGWGGGPWGPWGNPWGFNGWGNPYFGNFYGRYPIRRFRRGCR